MGARDSIIGVCARSRGAGALDGKMLIVVGSIVAMSQHTAKLPTKGGAHAIQVGAEIGFLDGRGDDDGARLAHGGWRVAIRAAGRR